MSPYLEIFINQEPFFLLRQKALYRPLYKQLILADIYAGKDTDFRKREISLPPQKDPKEIDTIHYLLEAWKPTNVVILGDPFHSDYNREWLWFQSLLIGYPDIQFILIEGSQDVLPLASYEIQNLLKITHVEEMHLIFSHHPVKDPKKINICGHMHPGIELIETSGKSNKVPCFYKNATHFILPAFDDHTSLHLLQKEEDSEYYLVKQDGVTKL